MMVRTSGPKAILSCLPEREGRPPPTARRGIHGGGKAAAIPKAIAQILTRWLTRLMGDDTCARCKRPLIEIDHYGERLVGCIECNGWSYRGKATGCSWSCRKRTCCRSWGKAQQLTGRTEAAHRRCSSEGIFAHGRFPRRSLR
jgi:hypothetical protein